MCTTYTGSHKTGPGWHVGLGFQGRREGGRECTEKSAAGRFETTTLLQPAAGQSAVLRLSWMKACRSLGGETRPARKSQCRGTHQLEINVPQSWHESAGFERQQTINNNKDTHGRVVGEGIAGPPQQHSSKMARITSGCGQMRSNASHRGVNGLTGSGRSAAPAPPPARGRRPSRPAARPHTRVFSLQLQ